MPFKLLISLTLCLFVTTVLSAQTLTKREKKGKIGFFLKNKKVIDYLYDDALRENDGAVGVKQAGKWGLIDSKGAELIPFKYDSLQYNWYHKSILVTMGDKFGLVSRSGSVVLDPVYEEIREHEDAYTVKKGGKWGLVDDAGEAVILCDYNSLMYRVTDKNLFVSKDGKHGVISRTGAVLLDLKYDAVDRFFEDSKALVKFEGEWGSLVDGVFETESEPIFNNPKERALFTDCGLKNETYTETKNCSDRKMLEFVYGNIRYPSEARKKGIHGTVYIQFVVSSLGEIVDPHITREIGGGCGDEVLRVMNLMKGWIPAMQDGKPVTCYINFPVKFKLD